MTTNEQKLKADLDRRLAAGAAELERAKNQGSDGPGAPPVVDVSPIRPKV